ncbi:peptidase C19 family protein [Heterostelium album PN500]|uniref:Peptidase C19 family protein n=1 Tax=Heterostelium pallidum (strain ATCC 26659 / Pp 5 / PN500) TaxID=670386 RepID=D3BG58_HETP5|nr:peptidase C19 family protein [Heterostelium album PN500]EFA79650.1 peptidase C19 family protein [Heterostelium album PN500]|eukprot:XP_020431771.1 peptidase C19 family protein [Heterostelium album PN500]
MILLDGVCRGLFDEEDIGYGDDRAPFPANRPSGGYNYSGGPSRRAPADKRSQHGFVGLLNQGATCYLNSLIQLMYMTPELKNNLYSLNLKDLDLEQLTNNNNNNDTTQPTNVTANTTATTATTTSISSATSTTTTQNVSTNNNITTSNTSSKNNNNNNNSSYINNDLVSFMNEDMDDDIMNNVEWEEIGTGVYPPRSTNDDINDINIIDNIHINNSNDGDKMIVDNSNGNNNGNDKSGSNQQVQIQEQQQQQQQLQDSKKLNEDVVFEDFNNNSDPFAQYDQDYVQSVLAFGFDESRVLEGLKKFPHVYQQERLINWILSDDVVDAQNFDFPDLVPLGTFDDSSHQLATNTDDYAAFSMDFNTDDNIAKQSNNNNNNDNNNNNNSSSKAIVLYDVNNLNVTLNNHNNNNNNSNSNSNNNNGGDGIVIDSDEIGKEKSNVNGDGDTTSFIPLLAAAFEQQQQSIPGPVTLPQPAQPQPKKRRGRVLAYELQRLFSFLQVGEVRAISTEDLTKSFGWYGSEASEQQDIHELNRILFDAVEHSIKLTAIEKIIVQLYRGVLINRIECTKCGKIKDREEFYQDIPIPIKGFKTLEDSLKAFVTPEVLDGDNKYSCDDCNEKVKANFGAKLGQLPPILVLPLRRFDFDYQRGSRVKITSQFEFPMELDMTPYTSDYSLHEKNPDTVPKPDEQLYELFAVLIHSGGAYGGHYHAYIKDITKQGVIEINQPTTESTTVTTTTPVNSETTTTTTSTTNATETSESAAPQQTTNSLETGAESQLPVEVKSNGQNHHAQKNNKSKKNKIDVPHVYSGWFDFNDSTVTPIPDSYIAKQFGNKTESAYMLIYRSKDLKTDKSSDIPLHLVDEMNRFNTSLEEQRMSYDLTMNTMFVNPRFFNEFDIVDNALVEKNNLQPSELSLALDVGFSVQDLYSHIRKTYEDRIDHTSKLVIQEIIVKEGRVTLLPPLSSVSSTNIKKTGLREGCSLLIWRGANAEGITTPPINFTVDYYPAVRVDVSDASSSVTGHKQQFNLSIERDATFAELLKLVAQSCQLPVASLAVYRNSANQLLLLEDDMPNVPLIDRVYNGIGLLVEDNSLKFEESALRQEFEMNRFKIQLYVSDRIDNIDNDNDSFTTNKPITIHCDPKSTIHQVKEIILDMTRPADKAYLLRSTVIRKTQRGGSPGSTISDDSLTLKEVDITDSSLILIEKGTPTQQTITIRFIYLKDKSIRTLYFPKKDTIVNLKKTMLDRLDIDVEQLPNFVLKTTDSFDMPLNIISEEDMTLEESGLRSEDLLVITEGIIPSKDEIILKFGLYQVENAYKQYPSPSSPVLHLNPQYSPLTCDLFTVKTVGDLSLNKKLTINELKAELLLWPKLTELYPQYDASQDDIRLWLEEKLLSGHGCGNKQLAKLHIQQEASITIEFFKKETLPVVESTNPPPILLYLHKRIPESQCFSHPPRQIYFTGKLISELLTQISSICEVEEEHLKIYKYVTHQHNNPWRIIEERAINNNNNNKQNNNNQLSINIHDDSTEQSPSTSAQQEDNNNNMILDGDYNSNSTVNINAENELPIDSVVDEPTNNIIKTNESVDDSSTSGNSSSTLSTGNIPPPPPPRPEKKKKPNTSNPNELRGKPWMLKDGDMIAFLDQREDPEQNDRFALIMEKNNYKSNNYGANNSNSRKQNQTTKYRAPERELKIQLDEY